MEFKKGKEILKSALFLGIMSFILLGMFFLMSTVISEDFYCLQSYAKIYCQNNHMSYNSLEASVSVSESFSCLINPTRTNERLEKKEIIVKTFYFFPRRVPLPWLCQ